MSRKKLSCLSACVLIAGLSVTAWSDPSQELLGDWQSLTNASDRICFYGNHLGAFLGSDFERSFCCIEASDNKLTFIYGNNRKEEITCQRVDNSIILTDSQSKSTSYTFSSAYTNACRNNIRQIITAQNLCKADAPSAPVVDITDMLKYLGRMPSCPHGGSYLIQPGQKPVCSLDSCNK